MNTLVVPTIRENHIKDFLSNWKGEFDNIIIIEDNPEKTFDLNIEHHYSWKEIEEDLKDNNWIISRRDSAIRSYGFLVAYRLGADYIFTLDDDCYKIEDNFVKKHIDRIEYTPKWTESTMGFRTRGIPYKNLGKLSNVVANVGLWTNIPDLDGVQGLANPIEGFIPPESDRIIPRGQYAPICGMNLCFKKEVAVLSYFPLMGENSPFKRFDNIWFGIIFKKICDHLGYNISCGRPYIEHKKASSPFVNLIKESPGLLFNEDFWPVIDRIDLKGNNPRDCMKEIGEFLSNIECLSNTKDNAHYTYLNTLGKAILVWITLFG